MDATGTNVPFPSWPLCAAISAKRTAEGAKSMSADPDVDKTAGGKTNYQNSPLLNIENRCRIVSKKGRRKNKK